MKTVAQLQLDRSLFNLQPSYQRGPVWSRDDQQLLIDSMLKRYDIPKVYFSRPGERDSERIPYDVVDGQQRLRAIYAFIDEEIELGEQSQFGFPNGEDLSGMKYSTLPDIYRVAFQGYTVSVATIEDATREQIHEMFLRLQEGKSLNPPEKRNAIICEIRDKVRELAEHKFMVQCVHAKNARFSHQDWIAHVACLIHYGEPAKLSAADLKKFYELSKSNGVNAPLIKRELVGIMNQLFKAFGGADTPELDVKWGFVDLFYLLFVLRKDYAVDDDVLSSLAQFYKDFELERRKVSNPQALLSPNYRGPFPGNLLFDYREVFVREGNKKQSITKRHEIYLNLFLARNTNIVPKDPDRAFSRVERLVLWRLAEEKCEVCNIELSFDEMDADHIRPHSSGGRTQISNGRCLCRKCNRGRAYNNN